MCDHQKLDGKVDGFLQNIRLDSWLKPEAARAAADEVREIVHLVAEGVDHPEKQGEHHERVMELLGDVDRRMRARNCPGVIFDDRSLAPETKSLIYYTAFLVDEVLDKEKQITPNYLLHELFY
jgi:hypothetical protein